ncbi:cytoplasmic tRNA 2-thiolation 1 [Labeo rohita]|uniref:Cytoplasmic tRNA 2-thiolation 1 n=2 Tax=Labeo rohita TaxID=84645 RepID=A0A498NXR9_LABRO|nr:cytoplasmic tRNA 2-thiolation 1 [Labeo rohita]
MSSAETAEEHPSPFTNISALVCDHSYLPTRFGGLVENALVYIAGFVVRQVLRKLSCDACRVSRVSDAVPSSFDKSYHLLTLKNNGSLVIPSQGTVKAIRVKLNRFPKVRIRPVTVLNQWCQNGRPVAKRALIVSGTADDALARTPQCPVSVIMPVQCSNCVQRRAVLKRPKTGHSLCKDCFFWAFEEEIHQTIVSASLFNRGETVAIGASGGKDSTVLAHVMKVLNERYDYGLNLLLLSVDEGITGYRDDSLETVKRNQQQYELPLKIVSYEELYGWTMDAIVKQVGLKNNCTFCGVFRRQALDRGAMMLKVDKICTGK